MMINTLKSKWKYDNTNEKDACYRLLLYSFITGNEVREPISSSGTYNSCQAARNSPPKKVHSLNRWVNSVRLEMMVD